MPVQNLTYRTTDNTRWGAGQGANLSAVQIDLNFWTLWNSLNALVNSQETLASIDYISVAGNQMWVTLTNHAVLGPFTLPTAQWNPRGPWVAHTAYAAFDVVSYNSSLYLCTEAFTSAATFSPNATDGEGHNLYLLLVEMPGNAIPVGGVPGQRIAKATNSDFATEWVYDYVRMALFVQGQPQANELLMQYCVVDNMTLPQGLAGSVAYQAIETETTVFYTISKNGAAIGSVNFTGPSPDTITVTFPQDVPCIPGDIITINGPAVPDTTQADISITLVAELT